MIDRAVVSLNMNRNVRVYMYFGTWILMAFTAIILNIINIDWSKTHYVNGIIIIVVLGVLQGSVFEFPVQTIATLIMGGGVRKNTRARCDKFTIILNYNLLALGKEDIDECMETMYEAYVGNLSPNVSAVLVSATGDADLKQYELEVTNKYRCIIYDQLYNEGILFSRNDLGAIDPLHLENIWKRYEELEKAQFVREYLHDICDRYAREFMVIHRVSRVLRKCGQYQDLMLLSEGDDVAYTYCDVEYYGRSARRKGEPLFHESEDASNIFGRKFDYTLVLDGDTGVPRGCVFDLLEIAAANPERGIIQPSIKMDCKLSDTIYMHLESIRQTIYEPMTNAIMALLDQSAYFGKAMIKNRIYIDRVIGTRSDLIERVPVDVLSHDTFEAAILHPLYAGSVHLLEAPSYNFITWNIRERRWNRGEILLAIYFWKHGFGKPMRWLQSKIQKEKFNKTKLRTESNLDFVSSYVAYSALRQMIMKPLLLLYVLIHVAVHLRYRYASIIIIMFLVLVFPKFATCTRRNFKYVLIETLASIIQFTPEAFIGCVRIVKALHANISVKVSWIPQRAVEEDFREANPFWNSLKHLWGYSVFALVFGVVIVLFIERAILLLAMLSTLFILPLYTGFTSLSMNILNKRAVSYTPNKNVAYSIASSPGIYKSIGRLSEGRGYDNETYIQAAARL